VWCAKRLDVHEAYAVGVGMINPATVLPASDTGAAPRGAAPPPTVHSSDHVAAGDGCSNATQPQDLDHWQSHVTPVHGTRGLSWRPAFRRSKSGCSGPYNHAEYRIAMHGLRLAVPVLLADQVGANGCLRRAHALHERLTWRPGVLDPAASIRAGCPGWFPHPRAHAVERAWDKPLDTGSLRAMITLPLGGGRRACEPADELTSQHRGRRSHYAGS